MNFYISPQGNDDWSGTIDSPNPNKTDGPFRTVEGAQRAIRSQKDRLSEAVTLYLRGGRYRLDNPIVWTAADVNPVCLTSYPGEEAIVSGSINITGWHETIVNGKQAWSAPIPQAAAGEWQFRQLFVNGERRERPRLPKQGLFAIEDVPGKELMAEAKSDSVLFDGSDTFRYREGDLRRWRNLEDVEIVVLHYWAEERMPIARLDEETRTVTSTRRSVFRLKDDVRPRWASYYAENIFEALTEPGEWYLDRPTGTLFYLPLPGETILDAEVFAPRLEQLFRAEGAPGNVVDGLELRNIVFEHGDWSQPLIGDPENIAEIEGMDRLALANSPQAAYHLNGVLSFRYAQNCRVAGCRIARIGQHGIQIGEGCRGIEIARNEIFDTGAGGITISGASAQTSPNEVTSDLIVEDNHIHRGGRVHLSAAGILIRFAARVRAAHNHIHDYYYTGISCGWVWGYKEHMAKDNLIAYNRIHDIGFGVLNDMGGIYLLGVQPGTVVRGNVVYRVRMKNYGGWGIYLDEGSSHIVVEGNYVFDTATECFNVNQGRDNIVRHNVFVSGGKAVMRLNRIREHRAFVAFSNILIATGGEPVFSAGIPNSDPQGDCGFDSDRNLIWVGSGEQPSLERWISSGNERFSLFADPQLTYDENGYLLPVSSPAIRAIGFRPFPVSQAGIRC
ncbi:MAG: right-handed parallel beta-helix repeat-containing protein [Paenibacillaceae bacterium]|nr:right-handed parallel beta-helix repeat-containing protein [Paenibacillaceae bacterium]